MIMQNNVATMLHRSVALRFVVASCPGNIVISVVISNPDLVDFVYKRFGSKIS